MDFQTAIAATPKYGVRRVHKGNTLVKMENGTALYTRAIEPGWAVVYHLQVDPSGRMGEVVEEMFEDRMYQPGGDIVAYQAAIVTAFQKNQPGTMTVRMPVNAGKL